MNSYQHAVSAARHWGGTPELYLPVEEFLDSSKMILGDARHRALFHHTAGVFLCQKVFGVTLAVPRENGPDKLVPVRLIAERHILEDLGFLPSPKDYLDGMPLKTWMSGSVRKEVPLSHLLLANNLEENDD